jgi:hypothetical protein
MRRGRVHDVNVVDTVLPHSNLRKGALHRLEKVDSSPRSSHRSSTVRYVIECVFVRCVPVWFNMKFRARNSYRRGFSPRVTNSELDGAAQRQL